MSTNVILGINDDTVKPYNEEIIKCLRLGKILSNLIFNKSMARTNPIEKLQKAIYMALCNTLDGINLVMDCNQ